MFLYNCDKYNSYKHSSTLYDRFDKLTLKKHNSKRRKLVRILPQFSTRNTVCVVKSLSVALYVCG